MSPKFISLLAPSPGLGYVMPSTNHNVFDEEKMLESILKEKIGSLRKNEQNLPTNWDTQLSYLLSTALCNYEFERVGGQNFATEEF